MSKSQPSISLSANSQGLRIRDSQLSPQSEEGMDMEASLQGGNASGTDVPSLPEDDNQEDINMDADESSEGKCNFRMDGLASPQSQHSFSINSLLLPEGMDDSGSIAPPSRLVQDHRTDPTLPKMHGTLMLDVTSLQGCGYTMCIQCYCGGNVRVSGSLGV
jgi:hypothetical protein